MIEQVLQQIGLTQNEIKVYLALLELGESKTGQILEKSELNSGKIYEILNSLQKKGLVSSVIKDKVHYFSPADPKRVIDYLEEKKQEINKQEKDYKNILPELLSRISAKSPETKIEIFTGMKGFKTAYAKELDFSKSETLYIMGINPHAPQSKQIYDYFTKVQQLKRDAKGYKIKKLLNINSKETKGAQGKKSIVKYLPYDSLVAFNIIGDLVLLGIFIKEPIIISIENQEVANNFKNQFEILWKLGKKR